MQDGPSKKKGFGTAPVFFTAISTILGAILFLRFGFAVGTLGFWGVILLILLGHMVTIPTALAISELATNQKVEGGGEYFIISRSFGLNIGATIGLALYLSQAISVAFYVIAFTEAFAPLFDYFANEYQVIIPRQVISLPVMALLTLLILKKGASLGVKTLYVVVGILFLSLILFFLGRGDAGTAIASPFSSTFTNRDQFFVVFAICFPAFTGMTAGVGLSGDLKNPAKSIPRGTVLATLAGMVLYLFIAWKLAAFASPQLLLEDQLAMGQIALAGAFVIPLGLAASTISSAIGSILVAPRTMQALAADKSFPGRGVNRFLQRGKGASNEPFNASIITSIIAFIFVALGDVNAVASIITMFFMVTYGALCLISFLYHFGAGPSYRPTFHSRWFISLTGTLLCVYIMFRIDTGYALAALTLIILLYLSISTYHKHRSGLQDIFRNVLFQTSRKLSIFLQKRQPIRYTLEWRPAVICISSRSFDRMGAFNLLTWIAHRYGFGTYVHLIKDFFSRASYHKSLDIKESLVHKARTQKSLIYVDTIISPSYTAAISQLIQMPGITGMDNNMALFEFDKEQPNELDAIVENIALARAGNYDVALLADARKPIDHTGGIHVWLRPTDLQNANLMILLAYIILGHPDWRKGSIQLFSISREEEAMANKEHLENLIQDGRLPIPLSNIRILTTTLQTGIRELLPLHSAEAGLVILGFRAEGLKQHAQETFANYPINSSMLFVNSKAEKAIT